MRSNVMPFSKKAATYAVVSLMLWATSLPLATAEELTWRTVEQMSPADRALYDPNPTKPRDPNIPYIPAAPYPFKAPYTAEEMGYRSAEFPHVPRWPNTLVDAFGMITSSGYINQGVVIVYSAPTITNTTSEAVCEKRCSFWTRIRQRNLGLSASAKRMRTPFEGALREIKPGEIQDRWMQYSTFPPESQDEQQLWIMHRTSPKMANKMDFFVYSAGLRRVRRQPQPRRDQRFPDNAQTFDDVVGRDPWEMEWKLLGTDVLYQTVRFPNTRPEMVLNDNNKGFVKRETSTLKMMGDQYPYYRPDGGVDCWVVMGTIRKEVLPNYNEKFLVLWLDKHSFFPIRTEKYGQNNKLMMIEVRNVRLENPGLKGFGYAAHNTVYWDLEHDIMSYSFHDTHVAHEWTEEQKNMIFTPEFMRREWNFQPLKTQVLLKDPAQAFLRPFLDRGKFPDVRQIELSPQVEARYAAQERAGHLIFETGKPVEAPKPATAIP